MATRATLGVTMVAKRRHDTRANGGGKDDRRQRSIRKAPVTVEDGRRGVADDREADESSTKSFRAPKRMKKSCGGELKLDRDLIWPE